MKLYKFLGFRPGNSLRCGQPFLGEIISIHRPVNITQRPLNMWVVLTHTGFIKIYLFADEVLEC